MDQPIPIQAARSLRMLAFNEILDCDIPALTPWSVWTAAGDDGLIENVPDS